MMALTCVSTVLEGQQAPSRVGWYVAPMIGLVEVGGQKFAGQSPGGTVGAVVGYSFSLGLDLRTGVGWSRHCQPVALPNAAVPPISSCPDDAQLIRLFLEPRYGARLARRLVLVGGGRVGWVREDDGLVSRGLEIGPTLGVQFFLSDKLAVGTDATVSILYLGDSVSRRGVRYPTGSWNRAFTISVGLLVGFGS